MWLFHSSSGRSMKDSLMKPEGALEKKTPEFPLQKKNIGSFSE